MGAREVLVTIEHPDGVAGVVREGRRVRLTDSLPGRGATGLDDHRPVVMGLAGDRTLQGGLLPPGAATAHVTDDAGARRPAQAAHGAWVTVLDRACEGRVSPVCFRDPHGDTVSPALPPSWARSPVLDAAEPCPACDGRRWDEVRASDGSRGTHGTSMQPAPFVVCRDCGHEHSVWVLYGCAESEEGPAPDDLARMMRESEMELRRQAAAALRGVRFAVYAARGWGARIGGWGGSDDATSSVTVDHGAPAGEAGSALRVQTDHEHDEYDGAHARARSALLGALSEALGPWPRRSNAGLAVWLHARERELLRIATQAGAGDRVVLVDGEPVSFATVAAGPRWAAVARRHDAVITVTARDVDAAAIELVTVEDPRRALLADPEGR